MKKAIIFDSGAIISFAMNGLLPELEKLRGIFNGKFIITKDVKYEIIDKPITIKKFELEALKIKKLLDKKILELPDSIGIDSNKILREKNKILRVVNSMFTVRKRKIKLIHDGEASCLALNKILIEKGWKTAIAIDERTTRLLGENPENLRKLMEKRLHTKIEIEGQQINFKNFVFLRSTELIYVAYKKGLVDLKGKNTLDALLYAMKFKGAAISSDEIKKIEKLN